MADKASDQAGDHLYGLLPPLRRFARALCGRDSAAAEALVDAAVAGTDAQRFPSEAAARIALHAALIHAHRRSRPATVPETARRVARNGIAASIGRLPLDQREVLLLVVLAGLTYDDAAAILALPRASILARLARARAALAAPADENAPRTTHLRLVK